ncbi:AI-2E family transporter [Belnapia rosea]|uniref:Predicted PurR-regulated permease PerM n=1 Tax=Belnapia rosea TaxID=938405 RepID=A0A1G6Y4R1_9PROT|nr:AI-2E family transporter [Belnapia rosea]SDB72739.1 Predicted PurR-regulated permease PerM [Belnapia rosea]SDD84687.1 Predicted PurR-regulated permease PerM [Belnapia rosea]
MPDQRPAPTPSRGLTAAGTPGSGLQMLEGAILVVAVLYFGQELLVPLVLAVLLAFVLAPVVRLMRRAYVPRSAAVVVSVLLTCAIIFGIGGLVGRQATLLAENLPTYQATIRQKLSGLQSAGGLIDRLSGAVQAVGQGMGGHETPPSAGATASPSDATRPPLPVEIRTPDPTSLEMLRRVAEPLLGPLATAGIVIILVIFILLYREDLRDRLIRLAGARDLHRTMAAMDDAAYRLSRFFLAQTGMNTCFGLFIAGALWLIGIPNPLLWGFVAGLMRFVPFIGVFITVSGPLLLALAVDPGWATLVWVLVLFGISEMLMGQVFEPLVFGHSTGLSPIAVIAAATFWTWLWGPIGLLLAVPLTVCLVVLGRHVDRLEFLEVMLGDRPPLDPEETFYQRALAGDANALAEQAERCLSEKPLAEYLDAVAMPALRLAQADAVHGALRPERRDALLRSVELLIEDLEEEDDPPPPEGEAPPEPLPPAWHVPGAVLCLPGRGPFDSLAANMLAQVLARRGFGVQVGGVSAVPGAPPRLICLCLLEGGSSSATARYLLRRARRRLPGVPAIALAWSPSGVEASEGVLSKALRAESETAPLQLAMSLTEALDLAVETCGTASTTVLTAPAPRPDAPPSLGMEAAPA